MTVGVQALTRYQSGTEVTPGTAVAATRIELIEHGAFLKDDIENHKPDEARNSYGRNYRSFPVKRHAEISGMQFAPTFERLPVYMQAGAKGGVTFDVSGGSHALQTSAAADDIIDSTAHGLSIGDACIFTSLTGGAGLTTYTVYYVIAANFAANTFQVSTTFGGSAALFTTDITAGTVVKAGDGGNPPMLAYTFKRSLAANDLKHFTWEVGDNVSGSMVAGCALNRWELGFTASGPMTGSMDWIGMTSVPQAFTGALADPTVEDINGALAVVYIDDTTIGSTLVAYPTEFKMSNDNKWSQLHVLNGALTPKENVRGETSFAALEAKIAFDSLAEYTAFTTHALRKVRLSVDGSAIHDAVKKNFAADWYGPWDAYDMGSDGGIHVASLKGESHVNSAFGSDWQIAIKNALPTLP